MDYRAYEDALNRGFSESEATRIGEDAFEDAMIEEGKQRREYDQMMREAYEAEMREEQEETR